MACSHLGLAFSYKLFLINLWILINILTVIYHLDSVAFLLIVSFKLELARMWYSYSSHLSMKYDFFCPL